MRSENKKLIKNNKNCKAFQIYVTALILYSTFLDWYFYFNLLYFNVIYIFIFSSFILMADKKEHIDCH